jgi:hypothetical protein
MISLEINSKYNEMIKVFYDKFQKLEKRIAQVEANKDPVDSQGSASSECLEDSEYDKE